MNTKLTISLEGEIIEKAKAYAKNNGRSLSNLIESYLKGLTAGKNESFEEEIELTPLVKSLKGSFSAPQDIDYKKTLTEELMKKHG